MIQPLWKTVYRFLKNNNNNNNNNKKLGVKPPYDPVTPLLGIYFEETKTEKDTLTSVFTVALFIIARTWKQARDPSTDEQIKKLLYIYTVEYYSAIKGIHLSQF